MAPGVPGVGWGEGPILRINERSSLPMGELHAQCRRQKGYRTWLEW